MTKQRRVELCEVAQHYNLPIISDEVYNLLNYTSLVNGMLPTCFIPTFLSALGYRNVISVSSFSKILAPGLRVGWIEFPSIDYANDYKRLGFFCSGSNPSQFSSCLVLQTMCHIDKATGKSNLITHIDRLRSKYAERYVALVKGLSDYSTELLLHGADNKIFVDGSNDPHRPVGGYFVWVKIPLRGIAVEINEDATAGPSLFFEEAKSKYKLLVRLGGECTAHPGNHMQHIRSCFAKLNPEDFREGALRLCLLLKDIYDRKFGSIK